MGGRATQRQAIAVVKHGDMSKDDVVIPISAFHPRKDRTVTDGDSRLVKQKWTLTTELSDLHAHVASEASLRRGFIVAGTRADIRFVFDRADTDGDGDDIHGWWYVPAPGQEKALDLAIVRVLVIND